MCESYTAHMLMVGGVLFAVKLCKMVPRAASESELRRPGFVGVFHGRLVREPCLIFVPLAVRVRTRVRTKNCRGPVGSLAPLQFRSPDSVELVEPWGRAASVPCMYYLCRVMGACNISLAHVLAPYDVVHRVSACNIDRMQKASKGSAACNGLSCSHRTPRSRWWWKDVGGNGRRLRD